jgi:hypothetical protein
MTTTRTISVASVAASVPTTTMTTRMVAGRLMKITAIASGTALKTRMMTKRPIPMLRS